MTPRVTLRVKVNGQGHQVKNVIFRSHLTILQEIIEVKGHMGQGQQFKVTRSEMWFQVSFDRLTGAIQGHGSKSKVKWDKVKGQEG